MNLASFVTGLRPEKLSADLTSFVPGRVLDDNTHVMLRLEGGAKGMLWASQVAPGNENALRLRVYGEKGGLSWAQEDPNYLHFAPFGEPPRLITRGGAGLGPVAGRVTRIPPGHPEGYLEGFATIYSDCGRADPGKDGGARAGQGGDGGADGAGWRRRGGVHRGGGGVERGGWKVGGGGALGFAARRWMRQTAGQLLEGRLRSPCRREDPARCAPWKRQADDCGRRHGACSDARARPHAVAWSFHSSLSCDL